MKWLSGISSFFCIVGMCMDLMLGRYAWAAVQATLAVWTLINFLYQEG